MINQKTNRVLGLALIVIIVIVFIIGDMYHAATTNTAKVAAIKMMAFPVIAWVVIMLVLFFDFKKLDNDADNNRV